MSIARVASCALFLLLFSCSHDDAEPVDNRYDVAFTGDLLLDRGVRSSIDKNGPDHLFEPLLASGFGSSILIANLECPVTDVEEPIQKQFSFRGDPEWLNSLQEAGVTHLNMANNHSNDQGRNGLVSTLSNIEQNGMIPIGAGEDQACACAPHFSELNGVQYAFVSSVLTPLETWSYDVNKAGPCQALESDLVPIVAQLRDSLPDLKIIVSFHWGVEFQNTPTIQQVKTAHAMIDAGANAVIGHHPHVLQPIEIYKGMLIFYSLGNFIFDQDRADGQLGMIAVTNAVDDTLQWSVVPYDIKAGQPIPRSDLQEFASELTQLCGKDMFEAGEHEIAIKK